MSEERLAHIIEKGLEAEHTTIEFEKTWRCYEMMKPKSKSFKMKKYIAVVAAAVCLSTGAAVSANYMLKQDNIDYGFKHDKAVIGAWKTVDFVENKEVFLPGIKNWQGDEYLKQMTFDEDGKMEWIIEENGVDTELSTDEISWTKGKILHAIDMTASAYEIDTIDGKDYMFYEWKSGDYTTRGLAPQYYVLQRVTGDEEIVVDTVEPRVDQVDLPFVNNSEMLGTWSAVDFVEKIEDFDVNQKQWKEDLYLKACNIQLEGRVEYDFGKGFQYYDVNCWTGNTLISKADKTASQCTIQEINGETYMFLEWKSGDYTIRGMDPYYYVLKKTK